MFTYQLEQIIECEGCGASEIKTTKEVDLQVTPMVIY